MTPCDRRHVTREYAALWKHSRHASRLLDKEQAGQGGRGNVHVEGVRSMSLLVTAVDGASGLSLLCVDAFGGSAHLQWPGGIGGGV